MKQRVMCDETFSPTKLRLNYSLLILVLSGLVMAAIPSRSAAQTGEPCRTQVYYDLKMAHLDNKDAQACSHQGICDETANRNAWVPLEEEPLTYVRLFFHIFRQKVNRTLARMEIAASELLTLFSRQKRAGA